MTIHALFVAITDYPDGVSDLPGCTNDLHAIRAFFADYASVNGATFVPTVLHNAEATRPGVIKAFEEFAAAGQDDVCVFYFSGHGSQVPAPREFWDQEPDRKCEAMVLADYGQPSGGFLVDKELSYLLATHTKNAGQVLVLVDSCHSGTITRMHDATPRTTALNIMNLAFADFHGHQEYKPEEGFFRPPVRPHFTFAACRPEQVAMEMPIRGVRHGLFTHYLIEVMSTTNLSEVSYRGLADRVRVRVKNHYPKQDVFVEASTGLSLDTAFFNGKLPQGRNQLLHFDRTAGWFFEQGEVAGIRVRDTGTVLDGEEDRAFTVRRTEAGRSFVVPQDWMDEAKAPYPIVQLAKQADPLPIFVFGEGMSFYEKTIKRYIDKEDNLRLAKQAAEARYHVKILPDYGLSLTLPKEERPLFETTKKWAEAIPDFIQKLAKIATYESILAMVPSTNALDLDRIVDIKLEQVFVDDYGDVVRTAEMDTDGCAVFAYQKVPDYEELEAPNLRLSVKVNEVYDGDLYVGMLFLDEAFGISNQFLKVEKISARDAALRTRTVSDGNSASYVVLTFSDELQSWGLTEITNYLKVVVSETPLQLETYEQKGLTQQVRIEKGGGMRGAAAKLPRRRRRRDRWGVKNIPITIYRPQITSTGTTATPDVISITSQPEGFSSEMMIMDASLSVTRSLASNTPTCPTKGLLLEPVSLMGSRTTAAAETPLDMVQLMDVQNAAAVTAATPLRMRAGNAATEGAMVLAFDEESRRYYPVGFPDPETGELVVQSLPEETPEEYTRSLGGSVKLFFRKVIGDYVPWISNNVNQLRVAEVTKDLEVKYVEDQTIRIAKAVEEATKPIALFIHGIIGDTTTAAAVLRRAKRADGSELYGQYDLLLTYDYENLNTSILKTSELFGEALAKVGLGPGHGKTLHIYAHSMGGLVSRGFIELKNGKEVVNTLIQFGTPNGGSPYGTVAEWITPLLSRALTAGAAASPYLRWLLALRWVANKLFVTLKEMKAGSPTLELLAGSPGRGAVEYRLVNGDISALPEISTEDMAFFARIMARFDWREGLQKAFFQSPTDIAVSVESQQAIPGLPTYPKAIGSDHMSYFVTPAAIAVLESYLSDLFPD